MYVCMYICKYVRRVFVCQVYLGKDVYSTVLKVYPYKSMHMHICITTYNENIISSGLSSRKIIRIIRFKQHKKLQYTHIDYVGKTHQWNQQC